MEFVFEISHMPHEAMSRGRRGRIKYGTVGVQTPVIIVYTLTLGLTQGYSDQCRVRLYALRLKRLKPY